MEFYLRHALIVTFTLQKEVLFLPEIITHTFSMFNSQLNMKIEEIIYGDALLVRMRRLLIK